MELNAPSIPGSKRFFKISELAGKRWPNVTESDIFDWHDAGEGKTGLRVPVSTDIPGGMVERAAGDNWDADPHYGFINLMAFWVFFQDFNSMRPNKESFGEKNPDDLSIISDACRRLGHTYLPTPLGNQFFLLGPEAAKGLSYNATGELEGLLFFDEQGRPHISGKLDEKSGQYNPCSLTIKKEDLIVKASSVRLMEQITPEITTKSFRKMAGEAINQSCQKPENKDHRIESTDLTIIAALLSILKDDSSFKTNENVICEIENRYGRISGLSKRTLEQRFAAATRTLNCKQNDKN